MRYRYFGAMLFVFAGLMLSPMLTSDAMRPSHSPSRVVAATHVAAPAHEIEIVGFDYAFKVPATVGAGLTTFRFRNSGKVPHELNISLLRKGATVQQLIAAEQSSTPRNPYVESSVGVLFASPGRRSPSGLVVKLVPGRSYAVICIDRDSPKSKPHFAMGMFSTIVPTASASSESADATSPARPVHVDTIVGMNYAFRYPTTVAPGHHRFAFVNRGTVRHEVLMLRLKPGVTLAKLLDTEKAGGDFAPLAEDPNGVLLARPGLSPLGVLDVEMLPGQEYVLLCTMSDDPKSPPHMQLGMAGTIRVEKPRKT